MKIGCVKEIKIHEYRVGLTPASAQAYCMANHNVYLEAGAGQESGFPDEMYQAVGVTICRTAAEVWQQVDLMIKVKEPHPEEYQYFRTDLIIFTYFHLAANPELAAALIEKQVSAVAYETVTDQLGQLPLLKPMSEVAGRLCVQKGANLLEKTVGGRGILLSGVPGVNKGHVLIIGGGTVGYNAAKIAIGMGARVTIMDNYIPRLVELDQIFSNAVQTLYLNETNVVDQLRLADLVIGAVLIPGAATPKIIKRWMLKEMQPGSVIIDVSVDQGGCCETTHLTYHDDPIYTIDGVIHYGVGNIPGSTPHTSTVALNNATLPLGLQIANLGLKQAVLTNQHLAAGLNIYAGRVVHKNVAGALNYPYSPVKEVIN